MKLLKSFFKRPARTNKYQPHQGLRERRRRLRQVIDGKLQMDGVAYVRHTWAAAYFANWTPERFIDAKAA